MKYINDQIFKEGLSWKCNTAADAVIGKMFTASAWKAWQRKTKERRRLGRWAIVMWLNFIEKYDISDLEFWDFENKVSLFCIQIVFHFWIVLYEISNLEQQVDVDYYKILWILLQILFMSSNDMLVCVHLWNY